MSKLLVDVRLTDLPSTPSIPALREPDRLQYIDRISLRLGLWLLIRGTESANRRSLRAAHPIRLASRDAIDASEYEALRRQFTARPYL